MPSRTDLVGRLAVARILIIADIHANCDALCAVLDAAGDFDIVLCAGDMVGYYDQPNEVCDLIRSLDNVHVIRGNHDAYVTGALVPDENKRLLYRTDWTRSNLSAEHLDWLEKLEAEAELTVDGLRIVVRHASPWDEESYIYPDSTDAFAKIDLQGNEMLVLGHTHYPLEKVCGQGRLVNPGSIGQPRDRDPRASYAVYDSEDGVLEFYRTPYDVEKCQTRLRSGGWPESTISILSRTKG